MSRKSDLSDLRIYYCGTRASPSSGAIHVFLAAKSEATLLSAWAWKRLSRGTDGDPYRKQSDKKPENSTIRGVGMDAV
jgi:hypothetical protein